RAGPVGDKAPCLRHREHAVRDDIGQPDRLGNPLVPVDDIEVAGRAAILDQAESGGRIVHDRDLGPDLDLVIGDLVAHAAPPRSTRVEYAVPTCSPSTVTTLV